MRIGWIGFHQEGVLAITALLEANTPIEAVITLSPERAARRCGVFDYESLCRRFDTPLYYTDNINDDKSLRLLRELDLDVIFVIGWSQILTPEALSTARVGAIGAHASLLPHNRGSAPVNWAIIRGEKTTGNTLIWLDPEVDAGAVIDQRSFPITPYDTCESIYRKVGESNRDMILELVPQLQAGKRPAHAQAPSNEAILPRRRPQDGVISWDQPAEDVYNFVRALARPYPGAFGWLNGHRWVIWKAALWPETRSLGNPGQVLGPLISPQPEACGQVVACSQGALVVLEAEDEHGCSLRGTELSEQSWRSKRWNQDFRRAS